MADINLSIDLDDRRLFEGLRRTERGLDAVGDEAKQTGKVTSKAFNDSAKSVDRLNKELAETDKRMTRANKRAKTLSTTTRGFQRNLGSLRFAAGAGIGAVVASFDQFAKGIQEAGRQVADFIGITTAQDRVNRRLNESIEDIAGGFVEEKSKLDALFVAARADNDNKKEGIAARKEINKQLGITLPSLQNEAAFTLALAEARSIATEALIQQTVATAQADLRAEITTEIVQNEIELQRLRAKGTSGFLIGNKEIIEAREGATQALRNQLLEVDNVTASIGDALRGVVETQGDFSENTTGVTDALKKQTAAAKTTAKENTVLDNSLADLNKKLSAVNKSIQEQVAIGDTGALMPLIDQQKALEAQIQGQTDAIKLLRGEQTKSQKEREDGLKRTGQLIAELTLTDEQRAIREATERDRLRQEEITKVVEDAEQRNELLTASQERLAADLLKIDQDFRDKEQKQQDEAFNVFLESRQVELEQEITLEEARLKAKQAQGLRDAQIRGDSEAKITALQAAQERERQELTLRSEKKRLELVLQFSEGRTDAEIAATKEMISAIDSELDGLVDGAQKKTGGKSIFSLLGLDPSTEEGKAAIAAIKQGIGEVVNQLENLFAKREELAAAEVQLRTERLSELRGQLDLELRLNEQGFASNVEGLQNQIAEEEKARQKAIEQQKKAQAAQAAIQTITQTVSLITAAANIFQSLSALPFGIGIPIAVGVIAAMFGAFIATKAQAAKASKLAKGGMIEGPAHSGGGVDMYVGGEQAPSYEAEGGEFVVRKSVTSQNKGFLKKFNAGDYQGIDINQALSESNKSTELIHTGAHVQAVRRARSENTQRQAVVDAIRGQTKVLSSDLTGIHEKPSYIPTDQGYMKVTIKKNGNKLIQNIKLPKQ